MIFEISSGWIQYRRIMSGKPLNRHSCEQFVDSVLGMGQHEIMLDGCYLFGHFLAGIH
jgi:hypothetical protein